MSVRRESTHRVAQLVGGGLAALLLSGAALAGTAASAEAATSTMSTAWRLWNSPSAEGVSHWTVPKGASVQMRCWTTGANRLGTAKWFYIRSNAYPFTTGYVPANAVRNQTVVKHC
jgi:hypothetical protein